jgi:hypothetical protein
MIFLLIRLMFFALLIGGVCYIVFKLFQPSPYTRCSRCDGKGFWLAARGRETCDWCKGSGKLPNANR